MSAKSHHGEVGCMGPLQLGRLRRPSSGRETGSRGHSPRATGACQKSAGCEGCVHQVCRPRSGVQKGRTLPLRVWVSRPHVDGGRTEGALALPCSSFSFVFFLLFFYCIFSLFSLFFFFFFFSFFMFPFLSFFFLSLYLFFFYDKLT